ncbi:MAG: tripartite tricarboxylate transporter substrate binding protein, partial [Proteobacteria bacterium]|nr:tripartite tricarboxylate transporter substrate binding protein [Pseudomonadota bacterium]
MNKRFCLTMMWVGLLMCICAVGGMAPTAVAEEFPTKPVRIIVPFAPGGLNDVVGRMIAQHLTERFGRQVIVE